MDSLATNANNITGILIFLVTFPPSSTTTPAPLDCGQPVLSPNVSVVSTTGTTEGDTVTLQCEPVIPVMITCNSAGVWSHNPAGLVCTTRPG